MSDSVISLSCILYGVSMLLCASVCMLLIVKECQYHPTPHLGLNFRLQSNMRSHPGSRMHA